MVNNIASMDTVYYDERPADEGDECQVKITGKTIEIGYKEDKEYIIYTGLDEGNGHFSLKCPEKRAKATLHRSPNSNYLEGFWVEEGEQGFWRITLK